MTTTQERVEAGAAWLDEHFPGTSWADKVDLGKLDMTDIERCVIGQLYPDLGRDAMDAQNDHMYLSWTQLCHRLGLRRIEAFYLGFATSDGASDVESRSHELRDAWTKLIEARLSPATLTTVVVTDAEALAGFTTPLNIRTVTITDPSGTPDVYHMSWDAAMARLALMTEKLENGWKVEIA